MVSSRRRFSLGLIVVAASLAHVGCAAESEEEPGTAANDELNEAEKLRPIGAFTGRLVLPARGERRPDGAVKVVLANAKDPALVGRTLWVKYADNLAWTKTVARDVTFSNAARESMTKGNVHPTRLDGLKAVSSLESLAGAHTADDVEVDLGEPRLEAGELVLDRDPVIIAGERVALVRIGAKAGAGGERKVTYFDPKRGDFGATSDVFVFDGTKRRVGDTEVDVLEGVERTGPVERAGYYVYGKRGADGKFHVVAVEPRVVRALPTNATEGATASTGYLTGSAWESAQKGQSVSMLHLPNGTPGGQAATQARDAAFAKGHELLVTHLFGAIGPFENRTRTGHFSFGVGRVEIDPFTREPQLRVTYKQVYAHNGSGIVSGSHTWASYEGHLASGHGFTRPVLDTAFYLPALDRSYDFGAVAFRPLTGLVNELDAMAARYRIGNGTGSAAVTPANSCIQDSSQALFFALMKLEENVRSRPEVRARVESASATDAQARDYKTLTKLADTVEAYLSPLGVTRADWRENLEKVAGVDACPGALLGAVFCGLASYNTIFPRRGHDLYAKALIEAGATAISVRTAQVGGSTPGLVPLSPTAPGSP